MYMRLQKELLLGIMESYFAINAEVAMSKIPANMTPGKIITKIAFSESILCMAFTAMNFKYVRSNAEIPKNKRPMHGITSEKPKIQKPAK